ncbi:hypothetical protein CALCODRAFT_557337 [Calocera cornea HHB12733]|uniref:Methyltransferase domain-containing protein n=1 Tax=Calocera cornea HHB12733 TaxID=1353952 RepID=A0A165DXX3_9BASI|nr:hypothetical protein CALCODRAFT_557337 [Calocera cornea HHB12733]
MSSSSGNQGFFRRRLTSFSGARSKTPDPTAAATAAAVPPRSKTPAPTPSSSSSHRRAASNADSGYATDAGSRRKPTGSRGPPTVAPPVPALPPIPRIPAVPRPSQPFPAAGGTTDAGYMTDARSPSRVGVRQVQQAAPQPGAPRTLPKPTFLSDSEHEGQPGPGENFNTRTFRRKVPVDENQLLELNTLQGVMIPYPLQVGEEARKLEKYLYGLLYNRLRSNGIDRVYIGPTFHKWSTTHRRPPTNVLDIGAGYGYWIRDAREFWPKTNFYAFDFHNLLPSTIGSNVYHVQGDLLGGGDGRLPQALRQREYDYIRMANMSLAIPWDQWPIVVKNLTRLLAPGGIFELVDDGWFPPVFEFIAPFEPQKRYTYDRAFQDMLHMRGIRGADIAQKHWAKHVLTSLGKLSNIQHVSIEHKDVSTYEPDDSQMSYRWWRTLVLSADAIEARFMAWLYQENAEIDRNRSMRLQEVREKTNIPQWIEDFHQLRDLVKLSSPDPYVYNGSTFAVMVFQRPRTA